MPFRPSRTDEIIPFLADQNERQSEKTRELADPRPDRTIGAIPTSVPFREEAYGIAASGKRDKPSEGGHVGSALSPAEGADELGEKDEDARPAVEIGHVPDRSSYKGSYDEGIPDIPMVGQQKEWGVGNGIEPRGVDAGPGEEPRGEGPAKPFPNCHVIPGRHINLPGHRGSGRRGESRGENRNQ